MDTLDSMVKLAIEYWKLLRLYERIIMTQPPEEHKKGSAQLRYASGRLMKITEECGIRLTTYEDVQYLPNLPVTAVNGDEFKDEKELIIDQTLEPALIQNGRVLNIGKVILKKKGD